MAFLRILFCLILCSGWLVLAMAPAPEPQCGLCLDCDGTMFVHDSTPPKQLIYFYAAADGP